MPDEVADDAQREEIDAMISGRGHLRIEYRQCILNVATRDMWQTFPTNIVPNPAERVWVMAAARNFSASDWVPVGLCESSQGGLLEYLRNTDL